MKRYYFLLLLLLPFFALGQYIQEDFFDTLDKSQLKTGILYDRVFPIANLSSENNHANGNRISQALSELSRADYQNRFPNYSEILEFKKLPITQNVVPISIIISEIDVIRTAAYDDGTIAINNDGNLYLNRALTNSHFHQHQVAIASPIVNQYRSENVYFYLPEELLFNTTTKTIQNIQVDFGNGEIVDIEPNQTISINYDKPGLKNIQFYIHFLGNKTLHLTSEITIISQSEISQKNTRQVQTIESTIAYQGFGEQQAYTGIGEYQIFLDNIDQVLDKPIILIDGFDPGDTRDINSIYQLLSYNNGTQNLADEARDLGYDVVILNFPVYTRNGNEVVDGGADFIQRNAFILVELINQINAQKVGDEELVIIGPSMGGLISRYALRYMEQNGMDHETRLWLSFDSPHLGANVPIGFQHLMNYIAYGPLGDVAFQELVDGLLRNPAARQMLLDHVDGHLLSGSPTDFDPTIVLPTGAPNFRNAFQNELDAMGFPQDTRNISISNGSSLGQTTGTPGMNVIDWEFYPDGPSGNTRALIELNFTPAASQTIRVSRIRSQIWIIFWITVDESEAFAMSPAFTSGLDSAPGGQFDISGLAAGAGNNPILLEFLDNLNIDAFDFIPTLSSMAITSTNNWYANVTPADVTVFEAYYIPDENEPHITLTPENVDFARNEIFLELMSVADLNKNELILEKNPVSDKLVIIGNASDAHVQITDITGKVVFNEKNMQLNNRTEIDLKTSTGLYILSVSNDSGSQKIKFVVR